jgi:parallel beta-helix repeat protein
VVSALWGVAALPAQAQAVTCGQVITTDTTLVEDLTCWNETALFIGAPGITLDLGGHRIAGQQTITNEGHDNVTIQNGSLVDDGIQGMLLTGVSGNVVRNLEATGLLGGIRLVDSDDNRVADNRVRGVFLSISGGSDRNVIARNTALGYESGIHLSNSHDNRVVDNISWTTEDGPLSLFQAHRNVVRGNTLVSGAAFSNPLLRLIGANDNRLVENTIVTYDTHRGSGIDLDGSNDNLIRLNEVTGAPLGVHIRSGVGNELRRNVANGAPAGAFEGPRDGFLVGAAAQQTLVLRNSASDFDGNGFSLFGAETAAGGNSATGNGAFGIDAIVGTIDLGGNTASGNGASLQCRNIVCG